MRTPGGNVPVHDAPAGGGRRARGSPSTSAMAPLAALLLALALPLAMPTASAQGTGTVTVEPALEEMTFSADQAGRLTVRVAVEGGIPGEARTVFLTVRDVPDDWVVSMDPPVLTITTGDEEVSSLRVGAETDGLTQSADIVVQARLEPRLGEPSPLDPGDTDEATVHAVRQDSAVRQVTETLGSWVYVIFLGLLSALVLAAVFALRSRRPLLSLGAVPGELTLRRGKRGFVRLELRNLGARPEAAQIEVGDAPDGWTAFVTEPEPQVGPGAMAVCELIVEAPADAASGQSERFTVTARGSRARRTASADVTAFVQ